MWIQLWQVTSARQILVNLRTCNFMSCLVSFVFFCCCLFVCFFLCLLLHVFYISLSGTWCLTVKTVIFTLIVKPLPTMLFPNIEYIYLAPLYCSCWLNEKTRADSRQGKKEIGYLVPYLAIAGCEN